jgi:hypothetical protein
MPENKYLKAMEQAKKHAEKLPVAEPPSIEPKPEPALLNREAKRKYGRPPGKRSNPDWEQVTVFMRTKTKKAALYKLMDSEGQGARDLSEVIDQLVSQWAG